MASFFPGDLARSPRRRSVRTCCQRCQPAAPTARAPRKEMAGKAASTSASRPPSPGPSFSACAMGEELRCPICYEPFREAVTLCCGHNFCKGCVSRSWQAQPRPLCPVCKAACAPEELRTNYTLANIVEMFLRQQRDEERKRREGGGGGGGGARAVCLRHGEEAKLFCLDDRELVCMVCQSSKQHADHRMKPLADMAENYRAKCKDMENSLRDKIKEFESMQSDYRLIMNHNKAESDRLEKEMKKQFEQLHRFLQNEEKTMLEELRKETQKKQDLIKDKIKKLSEESDALLQEVGQLQADLKDDDISFLKKHKNRKRRIAWTVEQPEPIPAGTLIEVTKHLDSLQYNVWKKMRDLIKVVPFSFDPNTATGWLEVSDDLTSISTCKYRLMVEVPERFSIGKPCVLGSKGFSKGSHTWEVDVSGTECWYTGVARKSCGYYWSFGCDFRLGLEYMYRVESAKNEKSQSSQVILPETGHKKAIKKLRVELDCDEGELSFYNAEWNSHIYTFHDKFGEVFPYFSMYSSDITKESPPETIKICPLRVLIKEEYPN